MSKCDYCCCRPSSYSINCFKCSPSRLIHICMKCSVNVNELKEHSHEHPLSTYQFNDTGYDENKISGWLLADEINLIEMIETCGLGNWSDVGMKMSKTPAECQSHFEEIYFSRSTSSYSIYFQSFENKKLLIGEKGINERNFQCKSEIYPPMLIDTEQQKILTYMPQRDEYEREYFNQAENRLPILSNEQDLDQEQEQDGSRLLIHRAKLALLRSYAQILRKRIFFKDFCRDYALGFNYAPDQEMDLHQISRFLSADEYERLVFNHRRIRDLLEELGCSTSSNGHDHSKKRRRRTPSLTVDCSSSSSLSSNESTFSFSSTTTRSEELDGQLKRRSIRRVSSSSSTNTSSKNNICIKEPLYTRRRVNQTDHNLSLRTTRSNANISTTSDISWDSSDDEEMKEFSKKNGTNVSSRTRSHTPPLNNKPMKSSPNGKRSINGVSKSDPFDPTDESTPKINRMLTRHQLVVQQTSPTKKRKLTSNSIDSNSVDL